MLFRRRKPADFWERVRAFFWPRRSVFRSLQYLAKRVLRLSATPHAIAAGVAAGVFASFTPFIGFHFVIAAALAWLIAGNMVASAIGTAIGNPLTFPFIWAATLQIGTLILDHGVKGIHQTSIHLGELFRHMDFNQLWDPVLKPMTIGAIPLGVLFAISFYVATRWSVGKFRDGRRKRLAERARKRAAKARSAKLPANAVLGQ